MKRIVHFFIYFMMMLYEYRSNFCTEKAKWRVRLCFRPLTGHEGTEGEQEYTSTLSSISALWVGG